MCLGAKIKTWSLRFLVSQASGKKKSTMYVEHGQCGCGSHCYYVQGYGMQGWKQKQGTKMELGFLVRGENSNDLIVG